MVLAPKILGREINDAQNYFGKFKEETSKKTFEEIEWQTKNVSGAFTGKFCHQSVYGKNIPVYISDYVLMGYGTGAEEVLGFLR